MVWLTTASSKSMAQVTYTVTASSVMTAHMRRSGRLMMQPKRTERGFNAALRTTQVAGGMVRKERRPQTLISVFGTSRPKLLGQ